MEQNDETEDIWVYIPKKNQIYLVVGFNLLENYESQWEGLSLFYYGK